MRFGSLMDGLAEARQGQAEARVSLDFARLHRVSPLRTLIVEAARFVAWRGAVAVAAAGRLSSAPMLILLGSAIRGFTATSSCQRLPRPRLCCANFQRESPGWMRTVFCVADVAGPRAGRGFAGRSGARGATGRLARIFGCASVNGTGGCSGWTGIPGDAGREEILGSAGAVSRT